MNSDERKIEVAMAEVKKNEAEVPEAEVPEAEIPEAEIPAVESTETEAAKVKLEPAPAEEKPSKEKPAATADKDEEDELILTYKAIRKQNRLLMGIFGMVGGMFLIMLVCAILIVPHVLNVLVQTESTIATVQQEMENLKAVEGIVDDLSKVSKELVDADLPGLIKQTEGLVVQSGEGINSAIGKLDSIDIQSLNEAITDLRSIVEPMAFLMGGRR